MGWEMQSPLQLHGVQKTPSHSQGTYCKTPADAEIIHSSEPHILRVFLCAPKHVRNQEQDCGECLQHAYTKQRVVYSTVKLRLSDVECHHDSHDDNSNCP